jgi:hypothetical protein
MITTQKGWPAAPARAVLGSKAWTRRFAVTVLAACVAYSALASAAEGPVVTRFQRYAGTQPFKPAFVPLGARSGQRVP